jgi:uncharacterized protein YbbC (DUF1343 family)
MNARALAHYLNHRELPGLRFVPTDFTPEKPYPYAGEICHGVQILLTDRNVVDTPELGIELASALHRLYPDEYELEKMNRLLASRKTLSAIAGGDDPHSIAEGWLPALKQFEQERSQALLYK